MTVFEARAATILYNIITSLKLLPFQVFLLPSNICHIVPLTFLKARIGFEFVDISEKTLCINEAVVIDKLKNDPRKYAGMVYVRTYGALEDSEQFFALVKHLSRDFLIIDDRCLCAPCFESDDMGSVDVALYSTGYAKVVDIDGGGFALLRRNVPYQRKHLPYSARSHQIMEAHMKQVIATGGTVRYRDSDWLDARPPTMNFAEYRNIVTAARALSQERKRAVNRIYTSLLPAEIQFAPQYQLWRFNIRVADKGRLIENIFAHGFFASSHYAPLDAVFGEGFSPVASALHKTVVNLFNDKRATEEEARQIAALVLTHAERYGSGE